ncbi:BamA/TamA family outer membrane protein [Marivirga sp. S37H4]|uniref:BamA/TamA family outer membrane protein n=1 Tax=Marivirga aurantiaca TaxID=2802615 RepID=A0A935CAF0_9BACT|nr:BamA/TamA family outer membrane protein [Marivirga aurantiaca]MBK6266726.1 BamA/TamA family outer membrane protein [Marivirga aurantiaca]
MNKSFAKNIVLILLLLTTMLSCNTLKHLPENERLYLGADISFEGGVPNKYKNEILDKVEDVLIPEPNNKIAGMRIGLWAYQKVERDEAGFFAKWVNKKIGEEPVLMSDVETGTVEKLMFNRLENLGFFYSEIDSDTIHEEKTGEAFYVIRPGDRLMIADYQYTQRGDSALDTLIVQHIRDQKILREGQPYTLDKLTEERGEIAQLLKDYGFYYFTDNYLFFDADTLSTELDNQVSLTLSIKRTTPEDALLRYVIGDIKVYPNYQVKMDSSEVSLDSTEYEGVRFIQEEEFFRPDRLHPYLLLNEGDYYNQTNEDHTSRRLNSLRTYRFVSIRFQEDSVQKDGLGQLNTSIYLSPMRKRAFRTELQLVSKSNNFAGPTFNMEYENRNLFRGGESFTVTGKIGYEAQISGGDLSGLSSLETGIKGELLVPRIIAPFNLEQYFRYSVPKTKFVLSYDLLRRSQLFSLNSFLAQMGYTWNANRYVSHNLNPISINLINLSNTTAEFEGILDDNPLLERSFEQQFIAGLTYSFQYNKLLKQEQKSRFFLLFTADFAGNTIALGQNIGGIEGEDREFLGQQYAQYSKFDVDVRHYLNLGDEPRLVSRVFAGFGLPYGNSDNLPFSKQYFSGGPNSVRAFRIRSLGPGGYVPEESRSRTGSFFDQAGDIKLEANLEYRFPIVSVLKGAVFTDAGNVWLRNVEDVEGDGRKFSSGWIDQVAVGAGVGLRVDIEFFVIRLDVATPLRKPDENGDFFWQDDFRYGDKSWRRDNVIWNFGIGYPF